MRKYPIVQEYTNINVPGTHVMKEKTNFMCGKMMDIEDIINITRPYDIQTIKDTNTSNLGLSYIHLSNVTYDKLKQNSIIKIYEDKTQSKIDSDINTKWIFEFDSKYLLREYLYNEIFTLNPQSSFNLIPKENIVDGNINNACYNYIDTNLLDRYRIKEIKFWTEYHELKNNFVPGTGTNILNPEIKLLYKTPIFSLHAIPIINTDKYKQSIALKPYIDGIYEIGYKQTKSSQYYTFIYYFDVIYEKI